MARDLDTECVEKMLAAVIEAAGKCDVTIAPLKSMPHGPSHCAPAGDVRDPCMTGETFLRLSWGEDNNRRRIVFVQVLPGTLANTDDSSWETITTEAQVDRLNPDIDAIPT